MHGRESKRISVEMSLRCERLHTRVGVTQAQFLDVVLHHARPKKHYSQAHPELDKIAPMPTEHERSSLFNRCCHKLVLRLFPTHACPQQGVLRRVLNQGIPASPSPRGLARGRTRRLSNQDPKSTNASVRQYSKVRLEVTIMDVACFIMRQL